MLVVACSSCKLSLHVEGSSTYQELGSPQGSELDG